MVRRPVRTALRTSLIAASALITSLVIACSSGSSSDGGGSDANSEYLADYISLLELIPDTENSRFAFIMSNYAMAVDLAGLQVPGDDASNEEILQFLGDATHNPETHISVGGGPFVSGWGESATFFVDSRHARGFDQRDVTAAAAVSRNAGMEFAVGNFPGQRFRGQRDLCCVRQPAGVESRRRDVAQLGRQRC